MFITVTPAMGRDYKSGKAALADWAAGKDFVNQNKELTGGGTYINKDHGDPRLKITIRYNNLTRTVNTP